VVATEAGEMVVVVMAEEAMAEEETEAGKRAVAMGVAAMEEEERVGGGRGEGVREEDTADMEEGTAGVALEEERSSMQLAPGRCPTVGAICQMRWSQAMGTRSHSCS
jgi:hypothetical protein